MVKLEAQDRQKLLAILSEVPLLLSFRGRVQALRNAGLDKFQARIDLEGEPRLVLGDIIDGLASYGRLTYEREALGQFLNSIKLEFGSGEQSQLGFLDRLLGKYQMMTPVASSPEPVTWEPASEEDVLEQVIGENTLRPIAFLRKGLEVARGVAQIIIPGVRLGTGFLVGPDLLITNHHILPAAVDVQQAVFRFNYQDDVNGQPEPYADLQAASEGLIHQSKTLDYSLVRLANQPGLEWGFLSLEDRHVQQNSRVNIIQHPAGMPKQISMQNNLIRYVDARVIQYITTTMPGSSGSPVLNDDWQVVALHHAGGNLLEPRTGLRYFRNEAITVSAILHDLPDDVRQSLPRSAN